MAIKEFQDEFRFLSNFYPAEIVFDGVKYPSAEHMYHAMKTRNDALRKEISELPTAGKAKRYWKGKNGEIRKDWMKVRVTVMKAVVRMKFLQNRDLFVRLKETGDQELIEGNMWHDNFWGVCYCGKCKKGLNTLGKILMEVRKIQV